MRGIPSLITDIDKATKFVEKYSQEAATPSLLESPYQDQGQDLN